MPAGEPSKKHHRSLPIEAGESEMCFTRADSSRFGCRLYFVMLAVVAMREIFPIFHGVPPRSDISHLR